jgi:hypothetical protein
MHNCSLGAYEPTRSASSEKTSSASPHTRGPAIVCTAAPIRTSHTRTVLSHPGTGRQSTRRAARGHGAACGACACVRVWCVRLRACALRAVACVCGACGCVRVRCVRLRACAVRAVACMRGACVCGVVCGVCVCGVWRPTGGDEQRRVVMHKAEGEDTARVTDTHPRTMRSLVPPQLGVGLSKRRYHPHRALVVQPHRRVLPRRGEARAALLSVEGVCAERERQPEHTSQQHVARAAARSHASAHAQTMQPASHTSARARAVRRTRTHAHAAAAAAAAAAGVSAA